MFGVECGRRRISRDRPHPRRLEVRPHICAALAARLADKPRLNVGEPHLIRPLIGRYRDRVRAAVVGAIDQDPSRAASRAHLAEGDFLRGMAHDHAADDGLASRYGSRGDGDSNTMLSKSPSTNVSHGATVPLSGLFVSLFVSLPTPNAMPDHAQRSLTFRNDIHVIHEVNATLGLLAFSTNSKRKLVRSDVVRGRGVIVLTGISETKLSILGLPKDHQPFKLPTVCFPMITAAD